MISSCWRLEQVSLRHGTDLFLKVAHTVQVYNSVQVYFSVHEVDNTARRVIERPD